MFKIVKFRRKRNNKHLDEKCVHVHHTASGVYYMVISDPSAEIMDIEPGSRIYVGRKNGRIAIIPHRRGNMKVAVYMNTITKERIALKVTGKTVMELRPGVYRYSETRKSAVEGLTAEEVMIYIFDSIVDGAEIEIDHEKVEPMVRGLRGRPNQN